MKRQMYDPFTRKIIWEDDPPKRADLVEVVRCKDCKFRDTIDCGMQFYGYDYDENLYKSDDWTDDAGYCFLGERKVENV